MVILPLLSLAAAWIVIRFADPRIGAIRALTRAFIGIGVWLVVATELLSLVGLVNRSALTLVWGLPLVGLSAWIVRHRALRGRIRVDWAQLADSPGEWSLVVGIGIVFTLTAIVAWVAPPQTWDSLNYHMARVAHWAQMDAVRAFATGVEVQNSRPPLAEFGMLHLYILASRDRWVNFVSWMAMAGSVIGVGGISRQLGLRRPAALLAMIFAATIPMGIVQASSTMTDYVVALFLVTTASEVLALADDSEIGGALVFAGASAGLAFLTKPTSSPFLLALAVLAAWILWRRRPRTVPVPAIALGLLAFAAISAGHATRSVSLYGDPFSGGDQVSIHGNQLRDARGLISNVIRNLGLQLGTPSPHVNKALTLAVFGIHDLLGLDHNDPRTTAHGRFKIDEPTTNENKSGNLIHTLVAAVALVYLIARRKQWDRRLLPLAAATLVGFVLFCWMFKWQVFGSRYHLPAFVLLAPPVGAAMAYGLSARGRIVAGWALLVGALPWLLGIASRPILPLPGEAVAESILKESRERLLLANGAYLRRPYEEMTQLIRSGSCTQVGLALSGNGAEYPIWSMLGAPREDLRVEWLVAGTPSARFGPKDFVPCAVVCEGCEATEAFAGLPLARAGEGFRLYLRPPGGE